MTEGGQVPLPPRAGPIVDADGHVVEPESAWAALPEEFRPRISADASGYEHVAVGDTEILAVPLGNLARPGSTFDDPATFRPLGDALPGGSDPGARLRDMDDEGIDQAVLYPRSGSPSPWSRTRRPRWRSPRPTTTGWRATAERTRVGSLARPCCRCRTRWPRHASSAARSPSWASSPGSCARTPAWGALSDRAYDAVWDVAEELDVQIAIHEGSSVILPTLGADRPFNPLILHAVSHSFEEMLACAQLIAFGTLERHPRLRLLFLESSGGWAPFWLERLDEQVESFGAFCPDMVLRPSEYFARHCAISFEVRCAGSPTCSAPPPRADGDRSGRPGQAGWGWGPRSRRPGRSPVASPCSRTTVPDLTVAT